jgi:hypothetical protein
LLRSDQVLHDQLVRSLIRPRGIVTVFVMLGISITAALLMWHTSFWFGRVGGGYGADYFFDADPSVQLGATGHLIGMFGVQPTPLMMPLPILVRVPVIAFMHGLHLVKLRHVPYTQGEAYPRLSDMYRYEVGVITLWVVSVFTLLAVTWHGTRRHRAYGAIAAFAILGSTLNVDELRWGHPEEMLVAALVAGVVICVAERRWALTWLLMGLGVATKQPCWLLLPTVFLATPVEERKRAVMLLLAVAGVVAGPFLVTHLGAVISEQVAQASISPAAPHIANVNVWSALPSLHFASIGRKLIFVVAFGLPTGFYVRRSILNEDKQLGGREAGAIIALVLLARTAMDPMNVSYYALPCLGAMVACEYCAWKQGTHILAKVRWITGFPVMALIAGEFLQYSANGWLSAWVDSMDVPANYVSIVYAIIVLIVAAGLIMLLRGKQVTRRHIRLLGLIVASLITALLVLRYADNHTSHGQIKPPAGFKAKPPATVAADEAPLRVYDLSSVPSAGYYLSSSAEAIKPTSTTRAFFRYSTTEYASASLQIVTLKAHVPSYLPQLVAACSKRCKGARTISTRIGRGVLQTFKTGAWTLRIETGSETVYISNTTNLTVTDVVSKLTSITLTQPRQASGHEA